MSVAWYKDNPKFFGMSTQSVDNTESIEFESGKKRYYLKNSEGHKAHSLSFLITSKADEANFWTWYNDTLLCRTQTILLTDLVTQSGTKEYRMTAEPALNDSQYPKECQISLEEEL